MRILRLLACGLVAFALSGTPPSSADDPVLRVYFGNLHAHTSYSDGSGLPEQAYARARDVAKMNFYAVTEHNHIGIDVNPVHYHGKRQGQPDDSTALIPVADRFNVDGSFAAIYGQEFSTISSGNHVNVFDVKDVIAVPDGEFRQLLDWLGQPGHRDSSGAVALVQFNHPATSDCPNTKEYGRDDFPDGSWRERMDAVAELISILNGPSHVEGDGHPAPQDMQGEFLRYLRLGFHLAPTADQDTHKMNWGTVTDTRTGVVAAELTRASILQALRSRHAYATEDKNLRIIARVNGHLAGDIAAPPAVDSPLDISIDLKDDDEPAAAYDIEVWAGSVGEDPATMIDTFPVAGDGVKALSGIHFDGGHQYFFFKIRQHGPSDEEHHGTDDAWTAPVWFDPGGALPPPVVATDISQVVASMSSGIYHVDPACKFAQRIKPENRVFGAEAMEGRTRHAGCPSR